MSKRSIRGWMKKVLSLVLALALMFEPSMVSMAANEQPSTEEVVVEEVPVESTEESEAGETEEESEAEESVAEESATEEAATEESATEESATEESATEESETEESQEEEAVSEETEESEIVEESAVIQSTSTSSDFVITDGVLTSYTGTATEVIIPAGVTQIASNAFKGNTTITSVVFSDDVEIVGEWAFYGCSSLKEVKLNEGLQTIGRYAFCGVAFGGKTETQATVYGTLTIPSTVSSIGDRAFQDSAYLGEVIFANGATESITFIHSYNEQYLFAGCTSLKKVTLPERATEIPTGAFNGCSALEEVYIGKAVQTIGYKAFYNCGALKSLECPNTLTSIGEWAFYGCSSLKEVELNEGLQTIGRYAFCGVAFGGKTETQATVYGTLTIPSTVSSIGDRAFQDSAYLGEVIFANGATESITFIHSYNEQYLFAGCTSLKKVTLPERATEVPTGAFNGCSALEEVYIGKAVQTIGYKAFYNCGALKSLECPNTLTSIGEWAFYGCSSLKEVELNEGLQTIGRYAFSGAAFGGKTATQATVYGTLTIPSTVYSIGDSAFNGCKYLETVSFANGAVEALTFEESYGNASTFQNCENLKVIYLPERLTALPAYTIRNCMALETLYIPKSVVTINENAIQCDYTKLTIYGEVGSAAETFAKNNNIQFKDKSELGIYAKSIKLNRTDIFFAGEEAMGKQVTLKATVLPSTAQNKNVVYSSNNEKVATVDANGVVTITGYGETDIVVTSLENDKITASCHVEIIRKWTDAELDSIRKSIEKNNNLTVVSNVYSNLQNLPITAPNGIKAEWKVPYEVETGVHTYDVRLSKDGYQSMILEDVTVTGITVTGIAVDGASVVQIGKSYKASVELLTEGGELAKDDYQIEWRSANTGNVKVTAAATNPLEATIAGSKISKNTAVTAKVVLNRDGKAVSVEKADLGKTWFESAIKVTVSDYAVVDEITVTATQNEQPVALKSLAALVNVTDDVVYDLTATASGYGEAISDVKFTWKSSNTSVAKVKADKSGKVTLTVLGKGTSIITVTAAKNGGYSTSFKVTVKDSTPRLVEKDVTVNRYLKNAVGSITLLPSDGYAINDKSLTVVDAKKGTATAFEVKHAEDSTYTIGIKSGETVKKGTYSVKILAKTTAKEEASHELPIKIKVVQTAPKVTVKQSAIDLYEKNGRGSVQIVTDAEISNISYTSSASLGNARLVAAEVDAEEGILYVKSENAKANNYAKTANKGTIKVTFADYTDEASYEKKITLSVNKKLPTITATPDSATLYPETLADTTEIVLYNKTADEDVLKENGYTVSVNALSNYKYTGNNGVDFPEIQALKGAKAGKLTYTITNSNWIDGVKTTAKCSLKIGKVPTLSFATSKVTLNTAYITGVYDAVTVDAYVKGFENIVFDDNKLQVVGKDAKSKAPLEDGALTIYMEDGAIKAGIADSGYFKKAGSYTYTVTAYSEDNMPVTGTLKVAVALAKSKASISFKTKGSINLLDRENTTIIATPKLKNYTGTVEEVELYGVNAGKFDAEVEDGNVVIKAQSGKSLKSGSAYQLGVYVTLDSGVSFQTQIKVTPKQKNPKLTQSTKSIVLFESAKGSVYGEEIAIDVAANQVGEIKNIKLASASDTFGYKAGADGTGIIYVKDTASLKPGKKYTVKLAVTFEDGASNAKPSYVSVKVDYRK